MKRIGIVLLAIGIMMSLVIFFCLIREGRLMLAAAISFLITAFGMSIIAERYNDEDNEEGGEE